MITALQLQNFRGFEDHQIPFHPTTTIIVGKNNAGKSTIVEALRLVSLITNRYQRLEFLRLPDWLGRPKRERAISPSLSGIEMDVKSAFHRYGDPPAKITCRFHGGEAITVYVGGEPSIHAVITAPNGDLVTSRGQAASVRLPKVQILPQIAPLEETEDILGEEYIKRHVITSRSSRHFRNQLKVFYEHFRDFKQLAEATWPGLRVTSLEGRKSLPGQPVSLLVQDNDFVAEVGWMGHGLQMWLQTMWFLTYSKDADVVILDEPDVYMHADLQRRLIRFVKTKNWQTIVATHSTEILAEVEPEEVLVVDRRRDQSTFAPSLPAVQRLVTRIGSVHNIQLARMWSSRVLLLLEGEDIALLKRIQNCLFPLSEAPLDAVPHIAIGGWGGWPRAVGSSFFLKNAGGEDILTYCLLDSDYHTDEQKAGRYAEARANGVELHIWSRKEIENYLLVPEAIQRAIESNGRSSTKSVPSIEDIIGEINRIAESFREEVFDNLCSELAMNRALAAGTANKKARERLNEAWKSFEGRLDLIPGKQAVSNLSAWSQRSFGASLSSAKLANSLRSSEVHIELRAVVGAIETRVPFSSRNGGNVE